MKNWYTSAYPRFAIKKGYKGVYITHTFYPDATSTDLESCFQTARLSSSDNQQVPTTNQTLQLLS